MPPWYGILTAAEIDPIWAYIRAMADRRGRGSFTFRSRSGC